MTPTPPEKRGQLREMQTEIHRLEGRCEMALEHFRANQERAIALVAQGATDAMIETCRDDAVFFYEAFLDLSIKAGKLVNQLRDLNK